jgi:acyl-CoA reductase-like NAD-dependent aldehyde dehydrogenase
VGHWRHDFRSAVAAFTPWNFPINQVVRKMSAALASGCSIIVKASEETPASPAELIRAFAEAQSVKRFSLATNAERVCAEIMLKQRAKAR